MIGLREKYGIDDTWTLFLDRDGVINTRLMDEYILQWEQFEFLPGVLESIKLFSAVFGRIFVVTNQQGVGKKLMSEEELIDIHQLMQARIAASGGRIDQIYYCTALREEHSIMRKPNVGMALKARKDFPGVNFKKSIMVGDTISDMQFGFKVNMKTIMINEDEGIVKKYPLIDHLYPSLSGMAKDL